MTFFSSRKDNGDIDHIEGETQLDNKDFKNTLKVTWVAETSQAPLTPVNCIHFDNIMTKAKLDEGDKFEDFVNYHSKVYKFITSTSSILFSLSRVNMH